MSAPREPRLGGRRGKGPADLTGLAVPTGEQLVKQKRARLAQEFPEPDSQYLPKAIRALLVELIEKDGIYPASAVGFLRKRVEFLRGSEIPPSLFSISRQDLPHHSAPDELDYPVLDYLTAAYFGASLFPLRSLAAMGSTGAKKRVQGMDPLVRRELRRKGLLDYEKTTGTSRLSSKAPDVRKLRAAMYGGDILAITRAAVNCYGNPLKQSMFRGIMHARLTLRADNLDAKVDRAKGSDDAESTTGQELRELADPANIDYVMERLDTEAKPWVEQQYAPDAEVIQLPNARVEDYIEVFDNNIFWFQDWDEETIKRYLTGFAKSVEEAIEAALETLDETKSVGGYADLAIPAARGAQYVEMYLGTTLEQLVTDTIEQRLQEYISSSLWVYKDTIGGGRLPYEIDEFLRELFDEWTEKVRAAEEPAMERPAANDIDTADVAPLNNVIDLAAVRAERAQATAIEPAKQSTLSENLTIILRAIGNEVKRVPTELRQRFVHLSARIGAACVRAILQEQRTNLHTVDLYVTYKSHSKLSQLNRLNGMILGPDQGMDATQSIIDSELSNLSDEEFAEVFRYVAANHGIASFGTQVFSEQYRWEGRGGYTNTLPKSRDRLIRLLEERPSIFNSDLLVNEYQRWKEKQGVK